MATYITTEIIARVLSGDASFDELMLVLDAAKHNPDINYLLRGAMEDGMFLPKSVAMVNPASISVCKRRTQQLPALCLAATSEANDCVIRCEEYVLRELFAPKSYEALRRTARKEGWLRELGTPLYHIGRLCALQKFSVARSFHGSLQTLADEHAASASIIVALDTKRLRHPYSLQTVANHAVVVVDVNLHDHYVEVFDPQNAQGVVRYDEKTFLRAWRCSQRFYVSIVPRGIRPYTPSPEYVDHIHLHPSLEQLAGMMAENAHNIWASKRLAEYRNRVANNIQGDERDDQFMMPFTELPEEKRVSDYTSSVNTLKLILKLGFTIQPSENESVAVPTLPSPIDADGNFCPQPLHFDDVILPPELTDLTEYLAENAHEEWALDRIQKGWTYAPKTRKPLLQSADLIPYCELTDSEKQYDREMAMSTLRLVLRLGFTILPPQGS